VDAAGFTSPSADPVSRHIVLRDLHNMPPLHQCRLTALLILAVVSTSAQVARGEVEIEPIPVSTTPVSAQPARPPALRSPFDASALRWIENLGQWPGEARFVARAGAVVARATPFALEFQLCSTAETGSLVRLSFVEPGPDCRIEPVGLLPGVHSYFIGQNPDEWHTGARAWAGVVYREVWPGVDLSIGIKDGLFKYDVVVAPGASLDAVRFAVEGHTALAIEAGALVTSTEAGRMIQPRPESFEILGNGSRNSVDVQYRIGASDSIGFQCNERDLTRELLIDPGILWASYLGSSNGGGFPNDIAYGVATAKTGEVVVVGEAGWGDFPVTPGAYSIPFRKHEKSFVTVFDPTGSSLVYSCLIGGHQPASILAYTYALAVDFGPNGEVVIGGWTTHADFPVTPGAFDTVIDGPPGYPKRTGFVTKIDRTGTKLVYSTFLEGPGEGDEVRCVRVDEDGAAVLGGVAGSYVFPVTPGAFDTEPGNSIPGFVCRMNPLGTALEWCTYLGAGAVTSLALAPTGFVSAAGITGPSLQTTASAFDKTYNGGVGYDCFAARLTDDGANLAWGTYLGGDHQDTAPLIAVHESGDVIVAGRTMSFNFPTTAGAFQAQHTPGGINNTDTFIARISKDGTSLVYSTYVASLGQDYPSGLAVDTAGIVTWGGSGYGSPITLGAQDNVPLKEEGYVARLSPDGKRLFYGSYVGGTGMDLVAAASIDYHGIVTVAGATTGGFPVTPSAFSTTYFGGQFDAFVARVELQPIGVVPFGESTPNCHEPFQIGVTEQPRAGSSTFSLFASGAPENALGVLALSGMGNPDGRPFLGTTLWLGTSSGVAVLPVQAQAFPYAERIVPIPPAAQGLEVFAQFLFHNTATCGGLGTFSATNALKLSIQ
jgi:hypothetical protein